MQWQWNEYKTASSFRSGPQTHPDQFCTLPRVHGFFHQIIQDEASLTKNDGRTILAQKVAALFTV